MANISGQTLRNASGNTKSLYSLLDAHADAIEAINNDYTVAVAADFAEGDAHLEGALVVYAGEIYSANSDIAEDTVFVEGVDANEWTKLEALDKVSKIVVSTPNTITAYAAVNKTKYLIDTVNEACEITLPLSSENAGMVVFAKMRGDGEGLTVKAPESSDEIDGISGATGVELVADGDFVELVATPNNGWVSTYKYIAVAVI